MSGFQIGTGLLDTHGRDLVQSRSFAPGVVTAGPPIHITDPGTGQTTEVPGPSITGTDHITVAVRYRPARYRWDYGDGTVIDTGSLGQAYPSISDVQHAYQQGSLSQPGQQYTYQLIADWAGDWFVSGDATGTGALGARQTIYAAGQVMREVDATALSRSRLSVSSMLNGWPDSAPPDHEHALSKGGVHKSPSGSRSGSSVWREPLDQEVMS